MPRVSVLMPVRNGARFVGAAIHGLLRQSLRDFEIIVVDDGSTDTTRAVVRACADPRIRLIEHERRLGVAASLNHALAVARGALIARHDHDDVSHPQRLERQVAAFERQRSLVLVGTQARLINEAGRVIGAVNRSLECASIRWYHLFDNAFIHPSVVFRREVVLGQLGGYDETLAYAEDHALWSRLMRLGPVVNLADRLIDYRSHATSVMGIPDAAVPERTAIVRRVVAATIRDHFAMLFGETPSDADVDVLSRFATGIPAADLAAFLRLVSRLLARYRELEPAATRSYDFRLTVGRQFDAVAQRVSPSTRRACLRVYTTALANDPVLVRTLSWGRALVLSTVGPVGLARLRSAWRAGRAATVS